MDARLALWDQAARSSLAGFIGAATDFGVLPIHEQAIAVNLQRVLDGEIDRLMIFMPPGHAKSTIGSILFPAYALGTHPDMDIVAMSYSQALVRKFGRAIRRLTQLPAFQQLFPECRLALDSRAATEFETSRGGAYFGIGATGGMAGRRAKMILIDDPLKGRKAAYSDLQRETLWHNYTDDLYPRLRGGGSIVLIQTRWHYDDLAGRILREHQHENWQVLELPAIARKNDYLGRKPGEALWPEAYPIEELMRRKKAMSPTMWISLYGQQPVPDKGNIFKRKWLKYFTIAPLNAAWRITMSVDTATSEKETANPTCITVWMECADGTNNGHYLLDVLVEHLEGADLRREIIGMYAKWSAIAATYNLSVTTLIEDKSSGEYLIPEMRRSTGMTIIAINPEGPKEFRARMVAPMFEAGQVFIPEGEGYTRLDAKGRKHQHDAAWLTDFLFELLNFPATANKDQVDSASQYLNWAAVSSALGGGIMDGSN